MRKHWIVQAVSWLKSSREPVPHEINELDWKVSLSDNKERLVEHLIAFANYPNGGYLAYGIADAGAKLVGVDQAQVEDIISRLTNLGRDAVEPPLILDHAVVVYDDLPLLFVYISEQRPGASSARTLAAAINLPNICRIGLEKSNELAKISTIFKWCEVVWGTCQHMGMCPLLKCLIGIQNSANDRNGRLLPTNMPFVLGMFFRYAAAQLLRTNGWLGLPKSTLAAG